MGGTWGIHGNKRKLERSCRKAEEKIQHGRFSSSSEFITERNRNRQA